MGLAAKHQLAHLLEARLDPVIVLGSMFAPKPRYCWASARPEPLS